MVMRTNLLLFGDSYWKLLSGPAMGTSPAPPYAKIYYSYHEETALLNQASLRLILYVRFIDDVLLIQGGGNKTFHRTVQIMNSFVEEGRRLTWDRSHTTPEKQVDFLDLTIMLESDGSISTKTYQKSMNLYLYLMPNSAHPPGNFRGMIYYMLQ